MIARYTPPEIGRIFSDESRLQRWLEVEVLACEGWARIGEVPEAALAALRGARIDPVRIGELEAEQGHDLAAFVSAVQETVGDAGRYLHLGLTSSDVVDTALATQLRDAAGIIRADLGRLEAALAGQATRHRHTVMPGRTHGVHAEPITLGIKLANHYDEVRRSRERLDRAVDEVAVGQLSGTVGTHATIPAEVEEHVCHRLGLGVAAATTQVIARDRHASLVGAMAVLAGVLERLATTVRLLQITEVGEAGEPFGEHQKGSSAMPHKRNPVLCERVCGMARVVRGHAAIALESIALWHERDISHSSAERVILPDACALVATMVRLCAEVVAGLRVEPERMRAHVDDGGGIVFSQRVLNALMTEAGWPRERAYRAVQALALRAHAGEGSFRALVAASDAGRELGDRLDRCFALAPTLDRIDVTYARLELAASGTPEAGTDGTPEAGTDGTPGAGTDGTPGAGTDERAAVMLAARYPLFRRGKVRDMFDLGDGTLLMVATDRISAFDVVLPTPIPGKGRVLTAMSRWWFEQTRHLVPNHLAPGPAPDLSAGGLAERALLVRRAERIDIECVVRGHLSGSGWKEYSRHGTLAGEPLPDGLSESSRLPSPRFTPAAKNDEGHDVNISRAQLAEQVGAELAGRLEEVSLALFDLAVERCERVGILLADTKFEMGFLNGELILIDELLTPDSSRFWEASEWREGEPAPSFDKQFVRDHLDSIGWDRQPPGPELPEAIVRGTAERYRQAASRICGLHVR